MLSQLPQRGREGITVRHDLPVSHLSLLLGGGTGMTEWLMAAPGWAACVLIPVKWWLERKWAREDQEKRS